LQQDVNKKRKKHEYIKIEFDAVSVVLRVCDRVPIADREQEAPVFVATYELVQSSRLLPQLTRFRTFATKQVLRQTNTHKSIWVISITGLSLVTGTTQVG